MQGLRRNGLAVEPERANSARIDAFSASELDAAEEASQARCAAEEARLALRIAVGGFAGEVRGPR